MKGIPLKTWEVRAILNGRKTVTRRVVKPQPNMFTLRDGMKMPYRPGDILYVREMWRVQSARRFDADARIEFKAGGKMVKIQFPGCDDQYHNRREYDAFVARWADDRWHPSIHMPFEAARIFLRVTNVEVQHVQDITDEEARKEGYKDREDFHRAWNNCYAGPRPVKVKGIIDHYESYPWENIRETRTYRGRPWQVIGNPWVFLNEFEQREKPKEDT